MTRRQYILPFLVFLVASAASRAQHHFITTITEQNGLSDNRITCFMKDRTGFVWIGTENGLNRYDGREMIIYKPGQQKHRLSHEHVNDIEQDKEGNLWVATWNGLNVLDISKDSLYVFQPGSEIEGPVKKSIASSLLWDTYIDEADRVWIAADVRDLSYYDRVKKEFIFFPWKKYISQNKDLAKAGYKSIQKIERKSADELWLGTSIGVFSFSISNQTFRYYGGDWTEDFAGFYLDEGSNQLYFSQKNVYRLDLSNEGLHKLNRRNYSLSFQPANDNYFLLPSLSGMEQIDRRNDEYSSFETDDYKFFSLHHDRIGTVYYDKNLIWLGTFSGVKLVDKNLDVFPFVQVFPDTLSHDTGNIYSVLQDDADSLYYISSYTNHCLVTRHVRTGQQKVIYSIGGKSLTGCTKIYKDSHGIIWLLTRHAIFYKEPGKKAFSALPWPFEASDFSFNDVVEDGRSNVWFASLEQGIFVYERSSRRIHQLTHEEDGVFAARPTSLWYDKKRNSVWIVDYSFGLFQKREGEKAINYGVETSDSTLMQSSLVTGITQDKMGSIWVTTSTGGISTYVDECACFKTLTMEDGLPENSFFDIEADKEGFLWATSEKGLTKLNASGKILVHYSVQNGLPLNSLSTPISISQQGELLMGVRNGFIKFHPKQIHLQSREFPVVLTTFLQGGKEYLGRSNPEFTYKENEFIFGFAALSYSRPEELVYEYKLDGYDQDWIRLGNNNSVRFTNLSNGVYTFFVRAFDYSGRPSSNIESFSFVIHPPFWRADWFIVLISTLGAVVLSLLFKRIRQRIRSQQLITRMATSLYGQDSLERVFDTLRKGCIEELHFTHCKIFLINSGDFAAEQESTNILSKGAIRVLDIRSVKKARIYRSVLSRFTSAGSPTEKVSALVVPVVVGNEVLAVIYSEHKRRYFFRYFHLQTVKEIAAICSTKVGKYFAEQAVRTKVARDLHDDIGSTLSSINISSQLALQQQGQSAHHLSRIAENSLRMMESMSDIIWSINPKNDSLDQVVIRMKEFAAEILEPKNIDYEFLIDNALLLLTLDVEKRKNIFLIFKEAINNAAKYSEAGKISIVINAEQSVLNLIIKDNGKGFDLASIKVGNGLLNMDMRTLAMKGELKRTSSPEKGTQIIVRVPIT